MSKTNILRTVPRSFDPLYVRRINRVTEQQERIGLNTCARVAEKMLEFEQIGINYSTVNQVLQELTEPGVSPFRVLVLNDWAKGKEQRYGTIMVDLERG